MGMYDPCKGQISLDGEDIRLLQPWTLRKCFGLVAQETQLFAGTIEDNIAYGLQKHEYSVEELDEAAKCAKVQEFLRDFDEGYSALVGDRGSNCRVVSGRGLPLRASSCGAPV